jgi:adenylate cyclase
MEVWVCYFLSATYASQRSGRRGQSHSRRTAAGHRSCATFAGEMNLPLDTGTLALVLAVGLVAALVALLVSRIQLRRSRRRVRRLSAELSQPRTTRAARGAVWAVKNVVDAAYRMRDHGVGGLLRNSIEDLTRWAVEDSQAIELVASPNGTVTLLFSDIEDSTALNEQLGDKGWVRLLDVHDELVHRLVDKENGHVVKSQGDGFMIAFGEPDAAVRVATGLQHQITGTRGGILRRSPIKVRVGIHSGKVVARDGDYFGLNVAMAARVAAEATGGEILVTGGVRESVEDVSFTLRADAVELKGIPGTHELWSVDWQS